MRDRKANDVDAITRCPFGQLEIARNLGIASVELGRKMSPFDVN